MCPLEALGIEGNREAIIRIGQHVAQDYRGFLLLWDWILAARERPVGELFPRLRVQPLRERSFRAVFQWLLYVAYLSPLFAVLAMLTRIQVSVLAFSLLGLILWRVLCASDRVSIQRLSVSPPV